MNFVYENPSVPLRVLLVNATQDVMVMLAIKAMRGVLFGPRQLVDLILLVYDNDREKAQELQWNLDSGAFPCYNSVTVTSEIPRITDADVFIFISNFSNPNTFEIDKMNNDAHFDSLYLFLKVANNLELPPPGPKEVEKFRPFREAKDLANINKQRPVIIADGIVTLDIVKTFSRNLPDDIFFCPSSMSSISKTILGDHLKVQINELNHVYVWAANDDVFHVDIQSPIYLHQKARKRGPCEWEVMADRDIESLNLDFTQFNAAWMKKDFIDKISASTSRHPHGNIYKSAKVTTLLKNIWKTRSMTPVPENKYNAGVISDGSLETIKGLPYFLPVIFRGTTFTINEYLNEDIHLRQEIKRINKAAWDNHIKLKRYCKDFLKKNVLRQEFMGTEQSTVTDFTSVIGGTDPGGYFPDARAND